VCRDGAKFCYLLTCYCLMFAAIFCVDTDSIVCQEDRERGTR